MKKLWSMLSVLLTGAMLFTLAATPVRAEGETLPANNGSHDYDYHEMTAEAASEQSGDVASNVLDGNDKSIWHSNYNEDAIGEGKNSITLTLNDPQLIEALRYLPRQGNKPQDDLNGVIVKYRVNVVDADGKLHEDVTKEHDWNASAENKDWQLAQFKEPIVAKKVILFADQTLGNIKDQTKPATEQAASNKFISAAELRLRIADKVKKGLDYPYFDMKINAISAYRDNPLGYANDADPDTFWEVDYDSDAYKAQKPGTSYIEAELKAVTCISEFRYLPRKKKPTADDGFKNGVVKKYEIQVSKDGKKWKKVADGTWEYPEDNNGGWQTVKFEKPVKAKFIRLIGLETLSNDTVAATIANKDMTAAEIRVVVGRCKKQNEDEDTTGRIPGIDWTRYTDTPSVDEPQPSEPQDQQKDEKKDKVPSTGASQPLAPLFLLAIAAVTTGTLARSKKSN